MPEKLAISTEVFEKAREYTISRETNYGDIDAHGWCVRDFY
jgi:hypothetical protein